MPAPRVTPLRASARIMAPYARPPAPESGVDKEATAQARRANTTRSASTRRRLLDPTPCHRDDSAAEVQLKGAMEAYKQSSGRMFPTWSEVLEVLQGLGYEKDPASV